MNIYDYDVEIDAPKDENVMEYKEMDSGLSREGYEIDSQVSLKNRPDFVGRIDRIENSKVVLKMFDETYAIPFNDFDRLFFVQNNKSPQKWHARDSK